MKVYLSGPVTGTNDFKWRFETCEEKVKKKFTCRGNTPEVINPVRIVEQLPSGADYDSIMEICFKVIGMCDAIVMMPDWQGSRGCNQEYGYARALGKEIFIWEDLFS